MHSRTAHTHMHKHRTGTHAHVLSSSSADAIAGNIFPLVQNSIKLSLSAAESGGVILKAILTYMQALNDVDLYQLQASICNTCSS